MKCYFSDCNSHAKYTIKVTAFDGKKHKYKVCGENIGLVMACESGKKAKVKYIRDWWTK